MKLYQTFHQEIKTPISINGKKIRYKTEYIERRREINLQHELQDALNYGGIERNIRKTQQLLLARYSPDEKEEILSILNNDDEGECRRPSKHPFEFENQWIDVWEYQLED